jgi:hypothetical protein
MASSIKITINATGRGSAQLDGTDLSEALRGFTLRCTAGEMPELDLDFSITEIDITSMGEGERTILVNIPEDVIRTLMMIGWTPPADDPRTYRMPAPAWEAIDAPALNERREYSPYRDEQCTCPDVHDPFLMNRHHPTCFYERHNPDSHD